MTGNKRTRERFGAVFFAFIMVTSMVAIGGAAFAGTAAAQTGTTIDPGSETAGQTTQYTVSTTVETGDGTAGGNLDKIVINKGGSDDGDNPSFTDVDDSDILEVGIDTDQDGTIDDSLSGDLAGTATTLSNGDATLTIDLSDGDSAQPSDGNDVIVTIADVENPANTGDKSITVGLEDAASDTSDDSGTLTVSQSLNVNTSPSTVTRGETANVDVSITDQNDDAFTSPAQVAIVGLTNQNDDSAAGTGSLPGESNDGNGEIDLDETTNDRDYTVLKSGSTTSGTFTTSITLDGTGQNAAGDDRAIGEYFVVVRRGSTSFSDLTPFSGPNPDTVVSNNFDGSALLDATPSASVETTDVTRGTSQTVSGSATLSDGSGLSDYPVTIRNVNDSSQVGSTATASNGDFATTETFADAATHSAALELYNTSTNSLENYELGTFDVSANDLSVSTSSSSFTASVAKSDSITLTADGADTQEGGNDVNITRFELSGIELSQVDVSNDGGDAYIDQIEFTDGTTIGTIDQSEEFAPGTADPDGDGTNEVDTNSGTGNVIADEVNIQRIVLGTNDNNAPNGDNALDVELLAPNAGDLTVEGQVEDTTAGADTANTPTSPDFVGTQTITAEQPSDLNIESSVSSIAIDDGDVDPSDDGQDATITVRDADGNGLINGASNNGEIQSLTFEFAGNGTQFQVETEGPDDGNIAAGGDTKSLSNTGRNLDSTSVTVDEADVSGDRTQFTVESLLPEQNGTIDVTVTADVVGQSNDLSATTTITAADSVSVDGLPSGDLTVGTVTDINVSVTDGAGTPLNNAQLVIGSAGPNNDNAGNDNDVFALDTDGDGQNDITGIDALAIDGASGTVDIEDGGSGGYDDDSSTSVTVNNGEYKLEGLNVTSAGEDIDILVTSGGETGGDAKAYFPNQLSTVGEDVYDVSTDVDPFVAGFQEQVNITVSQNGQTINGTELNNLAGSGNSEVAQDGSTLTTITGGDTVDLDNDGTDETIQVDVTPTSTSDVNVTIANAGNDEIGVLNVGVAEPDVQTNLSGVFTERLEHDVEITVVDPRDGSNLFDGDTTPNLAVTAHNGTVELAQPDGTEISEVDAGETLVNEQGGGSHLADISNGNQSVTVLPYRKSGDSGPFNISLSVSTDTNNGGGTAGDAIEDYYGATNFTVNPQQIDVSPESINVGEQSTVQIVAEDANNEALGQRRIDLSGSGVTVRDIQTDASGFVAAQIEPAATGNITVFTASDGGASNDISTDTNEGTILAQQDANTDDTAANTASDPPEQGAAEGVIQVTTEQSDFDVSLSQTTITANESTSLTVTATNAATGDAVEGATVDLSGAGINESAQTDANGEASFTVNASSVGTVDVTVNDAGFNQATATITAEVGAGTDEELARFDGGDGIIDRDEAVDAIVAYNTGGTIGGEEVTRDQAVQVIIAYNTGQTVAA